MRKVLALLLALMLALAVWPSLAEGTRMELAGYDSADVGHDWSNNLFFERMADATGVSFDLHQFTDETEWTREKQRYLKGEGLPDALFKAQLSPQETLSLYEAGVLIDLRPYLQENAPKLWALLEANPDWLEAITLPDGAIVALPQLDPLLSQNAMWINTRWLRGLGLSVPTTADELLTVLRAFKTQDPNLNGKADEVPLCFTGMWDLRFLQHAFGFIANDYGVALGEDGQLHEYLTADENRAFLTWLHTLWEEGLLDRQGFSTTSDNRAITDSNATAIYGIVFGPTPMTMMPTEMTDDYALLMPLQGDGQSTYRSIFGEVRRGAFAITSACQDVASALKWVDYLYTEEGCFLARSGMEGKEYERLSNGVWYWLDDAETVVNTVLKDITISEGATIPGYTPASYSISYDDERAARVMKELLGLAEVSREACPQVYLTAAQQAKVETLWPAIGNYAENAMAQFVTGDIPLTDENWSAYVAEIKRLGMEELLTLWREVYESK